MLQVLLSFGTREAKTAGILKHKEAIALHQRNSEVTVTSASSFYISKYMYLKEPQKPQHATHVAVTIQTSFST